MTAKEALLDRVSKMSEAEAGGILGLIARNGPATLAKPGRWSNPARQPDDRSELPPIIQELMRLADSVPLEDFEGLPPSSDIDEVIYRRGLPPD